MVYKLDSAGRLTDADGREVPLSQALTDRQQTTIAYVQAAHAGCPAEIDDCCEAWVGGLRAVTFATPVGSLVATLLANGESVRFVDED